MPSTSTKKRRLSSGFGVRSSACPIRATSCSASVTARRAAAGRRGRTRARLPASFARFSCSRSARCSRRASTSSTRSRSTTTAPSASSTTTSPWRIVAPPTSTGSPIAPRTVLLRAGHAHEARPDRKAELAELLDVAHGARRRGSRRRRDAFACVASSSPIERHRRRLGHRQHEHLAGLRLGDGRMDHEVVVLAAANGPRGPGGPGARHDLDQVDVDHRRASGRLVDGRASRAAPARRRRRSQRAHDLRRHALERLGVADRRVARRAAGVVAALLGALRVVVTRYACAFISAIAAFFCSITGVMSTNVVGTKLQSSGWCGSKSSSSGGCTVSKALGDPGARRPAPGRARPRRTRPRGRG